MKFILRAARAALALTLCLSAGQAFASAANMVTTGATNPPIGHYEFCKRLPRECAEISAPSAPMVLTPSTWQDILDVNYTVNSTVRPMTDQDIYGRDEYWAYPTTVGDCEDYALLKRRMLIERGFSPADVLITVVLQPSGAGHAVLTVRTDRGDFILDNMRDKVLLWSDTEYTFLKRQSSLNSGRWDKLRDNGRPALVGSVR